MGELVFGLVLLLMGTISALLTDRADQVSMPSYRSGIFIIVAGVAMMIGRNPLAQMQYAALEQTRMIWANRSATLVRLRQIIIGGSALFITLGIYLALNPLSA